MTNDIARQVAQVVDQMAYVFGPPWWKVWRRPWLTKKRVQRAVEAAFNGDTEPLRAYGISIFARPGTAPFAELERQVRLLKP